MALPEVLVESQTTLPEDRFYLSDDNKHILCGSCGKDVVDIDGGGLDLNTLIRLSYAHLAECGAS